MRVAKINLVFAPAGATWWQEWIAPTDLETTRAAIRRGPLRID